MPRNRTVYSGCADPSHRAFGYCSCKQDIKAILGTTILSNEKGHFGQTFRAGPEYSGRTVQTEMDRSI